MEKFGFADLIVEMNCRYPLLKERSRKYLLPETDDRKPDITVDLKEEDFLRYEKKVPDADREVCEYMLAGDCFYRRLLSFDGMLLHSSVVCFEDTAYVFSANRQNNGV